MATIQPRYGTLYALVLAGLLASACAPAATPGPTPAPAKPAPPTAAPAATAAPAKPAATAAPAKPAATQAPAAKPTEKPTAKVDTKVIEDFYKGKTAKIIVGSAPGGGFDTYARAIARHIGRNIPGAPNAIVENMAGAGSLRAANHVYRAADKDGTVIGSIQGGLFLQELLGLPGVEYETLKWMEQGEVDGLCGWGWESLRATGLDPVRAGDWRIISQITEQPIKAPEMEKVPLALDLAKTDEARQLIRLGIIVPGKVLRPYLVAPEVPAERVQALRQAFQATMKDPEFLKDAERTQLELDPGSGEEAQRLLRDLFAMPESVKTKLKQINDKKL